MAGALLWPAHNLVPCAIVCWADGSCSTMTAGTLNQKEGRAFFTLYCTHPVHLHGMCYQAGMHSTATRSSAQLSSMRGLYSGALHRRGSPNRNSGKWPQVARERLMAEELHW